MRWIVLNHKDIEMNISTLMKRSGNRSGINVEHF
jgi:hypothetical protein